MVLLRRSAPPRTLAPLAPLLRTAASGIMFVRGLTSTSCLRPHRQQRRDKGSASGKLFGEGGVSWLALPPGGRGLNKKLFDDRPLFLLTPRPPRRLGVVIGLAAKNQTPFALQKLRSPGTEH